MGFEIDPVARDVALHRWVLPECLHVPTGAINEEAIQTYIGDIVCTVSKRTVNKALLVRAKPPALADRNLPIWREPGAEVLHRPLQLWVHVKYSAYRAAYKRAFPDDDVTGKIISHAMNRRFGKLTGFNYVRVTPTSRSSNSSSGTREHWAIRMYDPEKMTQEKMRRGASIRYGDLADLLLMMDVKLGGGIMDNVNEGQRLIAPEI